MPKSLFLDLRSCVLAAIEGGSSCRQLRRDFGVSASSAIRWQALRRLAATGVPQAARWRWAVATHEAHGDLIRALLLETPDITLPGAERAAGTVGRTHSLSVAAL